MTIITRISQAMQQVLTQTAMKAAQDTGFIQRQMKVSGANFCQTVVLGWLQDPEATLESLCQMGVTVGLEITPQGLDQRFTKAASDCLYQVLQSALTETVQVKSGASCNASMACIIEDSSSITLPEEFDCGLARVWWQRFRQQWGCQAASRWDMLRGDTRWATPHGWTP